MEAFEKKKREKDIGEGKEDEKIGKGEGGKRVEEEDGRRGGTEGK